MRSIRWMVLSLAVLAPVAGRAAVDIGISIGIAPPALPVYVQPAVPAPGFIWTPGYWAYGPEGYYWVPGVWVRPPAVGVLWTPGYWGWGGGHYLWHGGYWGPHVGFYGGINYGFGYGGVGFEGGVWRGGVFAYNTAVTHVDVNIIHNTYVHNVAVVNVHTAFNGPGGIQARASASEMAAAHEQHTAMIAAQMNHEAAARADRTQLASVNGGRPAAAAMSRVGDPHPVAAAGADRNLVNQRIANQQARIANGARSGQMTAGETARADRTQARIDSQVHNDRMANGGKLNPQEKQQVNREQNKASKQIANEKHNDAKEPRAK